MIKRMEHVGIVVEDLPAAIAFFVELGLELEGEASVASGVIDRINGLNGVKADIAMLKTPNGDRLELCTYHAPQVHAGDQTAPPNVIGLRHVAFSVEGIEDVVERLRPHGAEPVGELVNYENAYKLVYLRGPGGAIVELAEQIG